MDKITTQVNQPIAFKNEFDNAFIYIHNLESYFELTKTKKDSDKLRWLKYLLMKEQCIWLKCLPNEVASDYNKLKAKFLQEFHEHEDIIKRTLEFQNLENYIKSFENLLTTNIESKGQDSLMLEMFKKGLPLKFKEIFQTTKPENLHQAFKIVRRREKFLNENLNKVNKLGCNRCGGSHHIKNCKSKSVFCKLCKVNSHPFTRCKNK